jgi:hypothetical protein
MLSNVAKAVRGQELPNFRDKALYAGPVRPHRTRKRRLKTLQKI